jgi:uncharacterized protein YjbJ (UPF0337 family)
LSSSTPSRRITRPVAWWIGNGRESLKPRTPLRGIEDVKGMAKEVVGSMTGRNDLAREGRTQQDKTQAQRDAAKKEAEAEAARGGAKIAEEFQKSHQ